MGKKKEELFKKITKQFYESSPTANEIRQVAIQAIIRIERLLYLNPVEDAGEIGIVNSELELLEGEFINLGIRRRMNEGLGLEKYASDPDLAIKYVAGQILNLYLTDMPNERDAVASAGEFDEFNLPEEDSDQPSLFLVDLQISPKIVIDFAAAQTMTNIILMMLDHKSSL